MSSVVLDEVLSGKLQGGNQSVDVLDTTGRVVGHYLTHEEYVLLRAEADFFKPLDPTEREQALRDLAEGRCHTTEELLAEFERIRQTPRNRP